MNVRISFVVMGILVIAILVVFFYAKKLEKPKTENEEFEATQAKPKQKNRNCKQEGNAEDLLGFKSIEQGIIMLPQDQGICAVIGVDALHYASLSVEEQETVDGAQASMLASLSFPIQPLSMTKPVDLGHYLERLKHPTFSRGTGALEQYAQDHIGYLEEETKGEILMKEDYLVIGVNGIEEKDKAINELDRRCGLIISALRRAGHLARVLDTPETAAIFYDIFHANRVMAARLQDAIEEETASFYVHGHTPSFTSVSPSKEDAEQTESPKKRLVMLR